MDHPAERTPLRKHPAPRDASSRAKIVVLGYVVRGPIGGMAWHQLQFVLGLARLGADVLFVEDSDDYPSCYDPSTHAVDTDPAYGLEFAGRAFARLGLAEHWAYYDAHRQRWHGPAAERAVGFCSRADALLNVSGVNPLRAWHEPIPVRVFIDTDPLFTQVRHLTDASARQRAAGHNAFFSFGEAIATGRSGVPDDGFPWQATRQPIVLDAWPASDGPARGAFTTVMQWHSYPAVEFRGQRFGLKSDSFALIRDLPTRVSSPLEIALGSATAPRSELTRQGWQLVDPMAVSRDPWTYQAYVQGSRGELSVAKHGYVVSRCGWFSERTACYLASGRPAAVQDTGFSSHLPCGRGLWAFRDADSAVDALRHIEADYPAQCRAARAFAAEHFDSRAVLGSLLERAFASANGRFTAKAHDVPGQESQR